MVESGVLRLIKVNALFVGEKTPGELQMPVEGHPPLANVSVPPSGPDSRVTSTVQLLAGREPLIILALPKFWLVQELNQREKLMVVHLPLRKKFATVVEPETMELPQACAVECFTIKLPIKMVVERKMVRIPIRTMCFTNISFL